MGLFDYIMRSFLCQVHHLWLLASLMASAHNMQQVHKGSNVEPTI